MLSIVYLLLALLLSSCGYQRVGMGEACGPVAISIPLIWSDEDGRLRENLAKKIASSGRFEYTSLDSRYQLIVKVERDLAENIGYVWDQSPLTGERINRLYPSESQRTVTAKVYILDCATQKKAIEPFKITVQSEYDFVNPTSLQNVQFTDVEGNKQSVLQFSLGQLDSEEGARSESSIPLYELLAERIAEALVRIPLKI